MKKNVAVFGLGIFGTEVALQLMENGCTVLAVDINRKKIESIKDDVTAAMIASVTDEEALEEIGIDGFDEVVLGLGSNFEEMVMGVAHLKRMGAKTIIARANTEMQKDILIQIGAHQVVLPEEDAARRLAQVIAEPNVTGLFAIDEKTMIAEVIVKNSFVGKSLIELNLRKKHGINAFMVKHPGRSASSMIDPNTPLAEGDILIVAGDHDAVVKVFSS